MNKKNDPFFDVGLTTVKTAKGSWELPIFYYDYDYAHFLFWVDHASAAAKLEQTIFTPCKFFNGKAGVLLTFFEYRDTAIGPYNEVSLSILCHPKSMKSPGPFVPQFLMDAKKWTIGAYVINLPVTTKIAWEFGCEVWSYPKFVTKIDVSLKGKRFSGSVEDPDLKQPIVSLAGEMGLLGSYFRLPNASFISHTTHHGVPLRTLTDVDARYKANLGFSGKLQINEKSQHIMARNLLDLGLQGRQPFGAMYCEKARMNLYQGEPIG